LHRRALYDKCDIMVGDQKGRLDVYPPSYGAPDIRDVVGDYDPADGPIKIYRAEGKTDGPMPSGSTFTANSIEEANAILLQIQQTVEEPGGPSGDDPDAESYRPFTSGRQAAHDEDGQPAQHNEERRQDDFSAGDTVAFATSFRNRTRGGPSYLIDSGTSAEVVRDVFEDGTRFEVRLSDGQLAIVPRETLRSARRTAQADEQTKRRIRQMVMQDISEDRESTEARIFGDGETRGFSRADVEAVIDEMVGAGEIVSTVIDAQNTGSGFVPALKKAQVGEGEVLQIKRESDVPCDACGSTSFVPTASGLACASCSTPFATAEAPAATAPAPVQQRAVVAQQDYPVWCAYCGEDAGASGRPDQVDLPSGRKVSLCGRHNRQSLDRYHDGGSAQFIQSVDKMPDSFWQTSRTAQSDWWDKMSPEQQQQYVEQHPGTKMQPGGGEPKQPGTPQQPAPPKTPKPSAPKEHGVTRDGVSFESPSVGSKVQVEDASGLMGARGVQPPAGSKGEVTSMKGPTHWGETWATIRWDNGQEDQYLVDPGHGGSGTSFAVDDVAAGRQKSQQGRISIVGHRRTAATPRVDQVLREVQGLKDDGYSDLDVMLSVFDKYGEIAEAVMQAAREKGVLDV